MENVLTKNAPSPKIFLVISGHFNEIRDFILQLENKLRSALLYSEIEEGSNFGQDAEDDEADELRATLHIRVSVGNELAETKRLLQTAAYQWITIENEGEIKENENQSNAVNV